jgi:hypothetical protein
MLVIFIRPWSAIYQTTYAELMSHWRLCQPEPRQQDISLRRYRLRQLQQPARRLRQALRRKIDSLIDISRQGCGRSAAIQLRWRRQRVCEKATHDCECDCDLLEAVAESGNLAEGGLAFSHQK